MTETPAMRRRLLRPYAVAALALAALFVWQPDKITLSASAGTTSSGITKGDTCPYKVETPHFIVEFSVPPTIGRGYATLCEKAYTKFSDIFQVPESEVVWEGKCKIYLFANHDQFVRFAAETHGAGAAISGGYTLPNKKDPLIVLFIQGKDHITLQQVLIHEMTHVFLQVFHKEVRLSTWIHEGFAQLFEFQHHPEKSRLQTSRSKAKAMVKQGMTRPLSGFWVSAFPATDYAGYAQAWSLVNFMTYSKDLRKKTGKYVLALKDRAPEHKGFMTIETEADLREAIKAEAEKEFKFQAEVFQEIFGISVDEFEARWKRYILATY